MGFGAVIVAGKQPPPSGSFAPLVQAGSISVIKRIIYTLQQAKVSPIVVMTGYESDRLERHVERTGVICMRDVDYESTSELETLKQGIAQIKNQCQGIVVPSVQTPFFKGETIEQLVAAARPFAWADTQEGSCPYPLCMDEAGMMAVEAAEDPESLIALAKRCGVKGVKIMDDGIGKPLGTETEALIASYNQVFLRPLIKVSLAREEVFFGPGTAQLLHLIQRTGSVRTACEQMHLSYSKAWKMIGKMEKEMGEPVVKRFQGGQSGGRAELTPRGEDLLLRFTRFERECKDRVEEIYKDYFQS
ncbi:NTP transferase domain-containing protein [Eubacterium sp.]|uniref:NTP transferase domain-containing protein n=1 Tax=Eubacterium sp. TaxID=142586 RepID=UPI002FCC1DC9